MSSTEVQPKIERVDDWHPQWPAVLSYLDQLGQRQQLHVTSRGWLPARQTVLAAFVGDRVVGHISFHVEPVGDSQPKITAQVDGYAVADGYDDELICRSLRDAAVRWAQQIHADPERLGAA